MITPSTIASHTGTYFLGEQGERGNSQQIRGDRPFPPIECLGNRGNTNLFLNISGLAIQNVWLSPFPNISGGERVPPLEAPETLAVPTVPPFPRFFLTGTSYHWRKTGREDL